MKGGVSMATVKQTLARTTGAGSAATRFRKSAQVSARAFARAGVLGKTAARRKSLGGAGG